jgi:hypothetical protein
VNGEAQTPFNWIGSLPEKGSDTVEIGAYTFTSGKLFRVRAWTVGANGVTDCSLYNDSSKVAEAGSQLCGTYTIGGVNPDFANFGDAVSALNAAGVACPVVFKVRDGVYNEQLKIFEVLGSSAVNTIRFEGESGDSSKAVLHYQQSNPANNFTLLLQGTDFLSFSKLGIRRTPGMAVDPTGYAVLLRDGVTGLSFNNCWIDRVDNLGLSNDSYLSLNQSRVSDLYLSAPNGFSSDSLAILGCDITSININRYKGISIIGSRFGRISCIEDTTVVLSGNTLYGGVPSYSGKISLFGCRGVEVYNNNLDQYNSSGPTSGLLTIASGDSIFVYGNNFVVSDGNAITCFLGNSAFYSVPNSLYRGVSNVSIVDNLINVKNLGNGVYFSNGGGLIFKRNKVIGGGLGAGRGIYGDYLFGNYTVDSNEVRGFKVGGINFRTAVDTVANHKMSISNNKLYGVSGSVISIEQVSYGLRGYVHDVRSVGNKLIGCVSGSGITIDQGDVLVANNMVDIGGVSESKGIRLLSMSSGSKIINNSVLVKGVDIENGRALEILGGTNYVIKNNIFSNSGGGFAAYVNTLPTNKDWDYNNYYSSSENRFGYISGQNFNSLSSWGSVVGGDANFEEKVQPTCAIRFLRRRDQPKAAAEPRMGRGPGTYWYTY